MEETPEAKVIEKSQAETSKKASEETFPLSMYQLPGDPRLSDKELKRFNRSKKACGGEYLNEIPRIESVKGEEEQRRRAVSVIEKALQDPNLEFRGKTVIIRALLNHLSPEETNTTVEKVIEQALAQPNIGWREWLKIAHIFRYYLKSDGPKREEVKKRIISLMKQNLENPNIGVGKKIEILANLKKLDTTIQSNDDSETEMIESLAREVLNNEQDLKVRFEAIKAINLLPLEVGEKLFTEILNDPDVPISLKLSAVEEVGKRDLDFDIESLLNIALSHQDLRIRLKAAEVIRRNPLLRPTMKQIKQAQLIVKEAVENEDPEIRCWALSLSYWVFGKNERTRLIREFLKDPNLGIEIKLEAISLSIIEDGSPMVTPIIEEALKNKDPKIRLEAVRNIHYAPPDRRLKLIKIAIKDPNEEVRRAAVIEFRSEALNSHFNSPQDPKIIKRNSEIMRECIKQGLLGLLVEPRLYWGQEERTDKMFRAPFEKTGSETTLLLGELQDKVIIRRIEPSSFLIWLELYENWKIWQEAGFEYVPIEPIVSFMPEKDGGVAVYTRVLGISLGEWISMGGAYSEELLEEARKIIAVLEKLGIIHGHPHLGNFCLVFERDADGKPDLTKKPRLYLIDFDMARKE